MMPTDKSQQPPKPAGLLADDHSELGELIDDLLAGLDEENKALSFERLDLLWVRLAVHIRAEHLCLFPSILDAPRANFTGTGSTPWYEEAQRAIDVLRHDHDFFMHELSTAVNTMRKHGTCPCRKYHPAFKYPHLGLTMALPKAYSILAHARSFFSS
jgi:hypothetical protein